MNCLRSLKHIRKISGRYKKYGLKTIIVHPPEWDFEKDGSNILKAVKKYSIKIPIIIDRDKKIIKRLKINFWPSQILIKDNKILYKHIGEGNYKKLEEKIQKILNIKLSKIFANEPKDTAFPTIYAGKRKNGRIRLLKQNLKEGIIYKKGNWKQNNEFLAGKGTLAIKTKGKLVSFVASSLNNKEANVNIKLNNKIIKNITIGEPKMYDTLKLKKGKLKELFLEAKSKIKVYSFAFR